MMNLIKADFRRIFQGKLFYIGVAIILVNIGNVIVQINSGYMIEENVMYNGTSTVLFLMNNFIEIGIWILINLALYLAVRDDFSSGTLKNLLASGISRNTYYGAKLVFTWLIIVIYYVIYLVGGVIILPIVKGFSRDIDVDFLREITGVLSAQLFMFLVIVALGLLIFFLMRNYHLDYASGVFMVLLFLPTLLFIFIPDFYRQFLFYGDLVTSVSRLIGLEELGNGEIMRILGGGLGYLLVTVIGTVLFFRKSPVK